MGLFELVLILLEELPGDWHIGDDLNFFDLVESRRIS